MQLNQDRTEIRTGAGPVTYVLPFLGNPPRVFLIFICCLVLGAGSVARPAHGNKATAQVSALVQRGEAALQAGDLAAAEQALTAAYRQAPHADLLFQLGRLAVAQQQLLAAQDLFRRYLNDPTATPDPAKTAEAQKTLARPRPISGKLRVQGDRGGLVSLDGRLLGRLPLVQPLLAAPGARTVVIQYPGKLLDVPVEVEAGRMLDIQCTRATGAVFLAIVPSLLVLPELTAVPAAAAEQLLDAVERAAQGEQLALLKPDTLVTLDPELKDAPAPRAEQELRRCLADADCQQRLLRRNKLEHALKVSAKQTVLPAANRTPPPAAAPPPAPEQPPAPQQWDFALELLRTDTLGPARTQALSCTPCTEPQAITALQDAVSRTLAAGLVRPRGTLAVTSDPVGAEVRLGERVLGRTPLSLPVWADEYTLELRHPGHEPVRRTVRVAAEKTAALTATLPAIPPPPPPPSPPPPVAPPPAPPRWERAPRPRWRLGLGGSALFLGVTLGALGGLVLGINQNNNCPPPMPMTEPPPGCDMETMRTQFNLGASLIPIGSALAVTGIVLLAVPGPRRQVPASTPGTGNGQTATP